MIRWTLDPVPHGPLRRVRIKADGTLVGNAFLTAEQHNDLAARLANPATLPCARCGRPVPAGQATHADCAPVVCRFCTQCGRPLSADEQAAGCRVCLATCAPLAEGIDVVTDALDEVLNLMGPPPVWTAEPEAGETEGPEIAATVQPEQVGPFGPMSFADGAS